MRSLIHVEEVADAQALQRALEVRRQVFVMEQGVDENLELDEFDSTCTHIVARHEECVIGTARLVISGSEGRIGRMAVLPEFRRQGVGGQLLSTLLVLARREGVRRVCIHAQLHAVPFYERYGFSAQGAEFLEADIPHVMMVSDLCPDTGAPDCSVEVAEQ